MLLQIHWDLYLVLNLCFLKTFCVLRFCKNRSRSIAGLLEIGHILNAPIVISHFLFYSGAKVYNLVPSGVHASSCVHTNSLLCHWEIYILASNDHCLQTQLITCHYIIKVVYVLFPPIKFVARICVYCKLDFAHSTVKYGSIILVNGFPVTQVHLR